MNYNILPIEIIRIIQEYSFAKCLNCNQLKQFDYLQHKIKIFKGIEQ